MASTRLSVEVTYLPPISIITGKVIEKIQLIKEATLSDLLESLAGVYGAKFREEVLLKKNPYIVILINGHSIHRHGVQTRLENGNHITIGALRIGG